MEIRRGTGVSGGYAIGEAYLVEREEYRLFRRFIVPSEVEGQIRRLNEACEKISVEGRTQIEGMPQRIRDVAGSILEAHVRMIQDPHFQEEIAEDIRKGLHSAEYAASRTVRRKIKILEETGSVGYVQRILSDFIELEKALLRTLQGSQREDLAHLTGQVVLVAHGLSPSQTLGLDRSKVLGILTEVGGPTSHTAIIARSLGIPAVVGVEGVTGDISGGDVVILEGSRGTVIINPDENTVKRYRAQARNFLDHGVQLAKELRDLPSVTRDGTTVQMLANIETPEEIPPALEFGAEGIGLYRTEFLYLDHAYVPAEKDHLAAYQRAISYVGQRKLVIRTMDLGADKMPMDGLPREENPFLGTRAIRYCLEKPEIFKAQLRAILKAAPAGNVLLLVPMISSLTEIVQAKALIEEAREELRSEGEIVGEEIPVGIMVEVPSAALMADRLAEHVDFFSVGTNDLIAFTMAVDRTNERVAPLYQPAHPAILRLLQTVISAGDRHGKPVSVCGEMSSDPLYTILLLGMGLRIFSVVPPSIPEVKKIIRSVTIEDAKVVAAKALDYDDPLETAKFLKEETQKVLPDAF